MHSSDFSSTAAPDRSAHFRLLFSLQRSGDLTTSTAGQSPRPDRAPSLGKIGTDANDGCAFPDHRWAGVGVRAIPPTGKGPAITVGPDELGAATTIAAADHGERRSGKWLQTFASPSLIFKC